MDPFPDKHPQGLSICSFCGRGIRKPAAHGKNAPFCNRLRWVDASRARREELETRGYERAGDSSRMIRSSRVSWCFGPSFSGMDAYASAITIWVPTWAFEIAKCVTVSTKIRRRWLNYLVDHPERFVELDAVRRLGGAKAFAAYLKQTKDPQ